MNLRIGEIWSVYAPMVGYKKYHLCICVGQSGTAHQFLFLNSNPNFSDTYSCKCNEIPCIPESDTGLTAISFSLIVRYTDNQLQLYRAEKRGEISANVAFAALEVARKTSSLPAKQLRTVIDALESIK